MKHQDDRGDKSWSPIVGTRRTWLFLYSVKSQKGTLFFSLYFILSGIVYHVLHMTILYSESEYKERFPRAEASGNRKILLNYSREIQKVEIAHQNTFGSLIFRCPGKM